MNRRNNHRHDVQALQPGLLEANDHKIRRVLAVVDGVADPAINQALLERCGHALQRCGRFARCV